MSFGNRVEAARLLAWEVRQLRGTASVVLGLPCGGVQLAFEVARVLAAPLDVIVVRKVGVPWQPELAMGAVGEDDARVVNPDVVRAAGVDADELAAAQAYATVEVERRVKVLRGDRPRVPLDGRTAVVVDDGIATGSTARAARQVARAHGAARVLLAVPVAPAGTAAMLTDGAIVAMTNHCRTNGFSPSAGGVSSVPRRILATWYRYISDGVRPEGDDQVDVGVIGCHAGEVAGIGELGAAPSVLAFGNGPGERVVPPAVQEHLHRMGHGERPPPSVIVSGCDQHDELSVGGLGVGDRTVGEPAARGRDEA